jgi:hypothetical protein
MYAYVSIEHEGLKMPQIYAKLCEVTLTRPFSSSNLLKLPGRDLVPCKNLGHV